MSSTRTYSVEELMNLTVADIQDPDFEVVVKIVDWKKLTSQIREQCILKLRELKNQRDELAQSSAVDANALTNKLNQIERSRSATPVLPPWEPDDPEGKEKESYEALIKDNGRPCYPIELGFDVFENPGQYKDILEYWQWGEQTSTKRMVFSTQLRKWEAFRRIQQRDRRIYVSRNWFHKFLEFVRERRRKHGLDGDVHLREQVAEQSKLDDWMEYQNHKLREYEGFEQNLKEDQEQLASERKALTEEGFSAFEEIEGLEFGKYYGMTLEWGSKEGNAKEKQKLAERKLRIAKKRSEVAQSEELGEKVDRDRWIDFFVKEVRSQQTRVDELQRLSDEAGRDVKPYNQWLDGIKVGWNETTEEGYRLAKLETSSAEYRTKFDKRKELQKRASEARFAHFCAREELEFAEELLEAARTEDLAPTVERAALIRRTQKEVRFAEFHLKEEKESTKVLDLKTDVISSLYSITSLKGKIKRHNVLLDWVERQRRELIGDSASTGQKISPRRSMRVGSRNLPSSPGTEASSVDHAAKKRARLQKPLTAKSILDPVDPAKVTKTSNQKRMGRRRRSVPRDTSRAAEKTNVDFNTAEPKSDAAVPVKDGMRARLRLVHSSRVSKPASKRPIGRQKDTTRGRRRRTGEELLRMSTSSKEVIDQSMNTSMQRSTRGSKRLRLGFDHQFCQVLR